MKLLRASAEPGVIQRLKSALEDAGIECVIRNELTSGLAPEIPMSESTPELWILEDDSLPQAQMICAALKSGIGAGGAPWTCASCGEVHDSQFGSCWKCGSPRAQGNG